MEHRVGPKCPPIRHLCAQRTLECFRIEMCHLEHGDKASYPVWRNNPMFFLSLFFLILSPPSEAAVARCIINLPTSQAGEGGRGTISWVTCQLFPPPLPPNFFFFIFFFLYVAARHKQRQPPPPPAALSLTLFQSEPPGRISQRRRKTHD